MVKMLKPRLATLRPTVRPCTVAATRRSLGDTWMAIRAKALARDRGLCQVCAASGRLRLASEVDHVIELADGGTDAMGNLQSICGPCHRAKSDAAQRARRTG